jgi:hypothetical protein
MSRVKETTTSGAGTLRARLVSPDATPCVWRFYLDATKFETISWWVARGDLVDFVAVRDDLGDNPEDIPAYTPNLLLKDDRPRASVALYTEDGFAYFRSEAEDTAVLWGTIYARFRNGGAIDIAVRTVNGS